MEVLSDLEERCAKAGLKMTGQRRIILKVLAESDDHPSVEVVYQRAVALDSSVSIATVYRTLALLDELGLVEKHDFGDNHSRFEVKVDEHHHHHHHLVDTETGAVIEFQNDRLEKLIHDIGHELGYEIVEHVFELYGHKIKKP